MQVFVVCSTAPTQPHFEDCLTEVMADADLTREKTLSQSSLLGHAALLSGQAKIPTEALRARLREIGDTYKVDVNLFTQAPQKKRLLLSDMDSTIIQGESLDELSEFAGVGEEIKAITKRAMAGEIDFVGALRERLAMLKGKPASLTDKVIAHTSIFDGASQLVATMRAHDARCYLVSGGFTFLTSHIAALLSFDGHYANELLLEGDVLAGVPSTPILDSHSKVNIMNDLMREFWLDSEQVMTIGDGANDIPMLSKAGLGVAWQGKPLVRDKIALQLNHSTHCGGLFLQGYDESQIIG